jgi:hypothetical protein
MAESCNLIANKLSLQLPSNREEDLKLLDRCKELCFHKVSSKYTKISDFISVTNNIANLVKASEMVRRGVDLEVVRPLLEEWKEWCNQQNLG